jgi:GntR family transcriptional repressor for pyruvate dehydrogenase complex
MSSRKISVGSLARSSASIVDDIVRHLERLIVTGALAAGEKIPSERSLSVELGVSRPVLREALSRLEAAGLVTRRHGSGTRVTGGLPLADSLAQRLERGSDEFEHSAEFREVVEPEIARLAAARISDEQLGALREIIEGSDRDPDADHSVQLDVAFHVAVAQAAGNPLLAALAELTASWTVEARVYSHLEGDGRRISHEGHSRVLTALERRDGEAAAREMADHLRQIRAVIDRVRASESAASS